MLVTLSPPEKPRVVIRKSDVWNCFCPVRLAILLGLAAVITMDSVRSTRSGELSLENWYLVSRAGVEKLASHRPQDNENPPTLVSIVVGVIPWKLSTSAFCEVNTENGAARSNVVSNSGVPAFAPFETPPITCPLPMAAKPTELENWLS